MEDAHGGDATTGDHFHGGGDDGGAEGQLCELRDEMPDVAVDILEAALELFARQGYAATSVREIVRRAEATNPMLYYYFDSKEGVFLKLIELLFTGLEEDIDAAIEQSGPFFEGLERVVHTHLRSAEQSPLALEFVFSVMFGPRESRPDVDMLPFQLGLLERIEGLFEHAIDEGSFVPNGDFSTRFLAQQLLGLINNHMIQMLRARDLLRRYPQHRPMVDSLLEGMTVARRLRFFLQGAGTLTSETP